MHSGLEFFCLVLEFLVGEVIILGFCRETEPVNQVCVRVCVLRIVSRNCGDLGNPKPAR